jgi:hypothetical protein
MLHVSASRAILRRFDFCCQNCYFAVLFSVKIHWKKFSSSRLLRTISRLFPLFAPGSSIPVPGAAVCNTRAHITIVFIPILYYGYCSMFFVYLLVLCCYAVQRLAHSPLCVWMLCVRLCIYTVCHWCGEEGMGGVCILLLCIYSI